MARSAAGKAEQAADALEAFLRDRTRAASVERTVNPPPADEAGEAAARYDGPRADNHRADTPASFRAAAPLRLAHTDWLRHRLMVSGPAPELHAFRNAAAGAGTIPWRLDFDSLQEDWFHRLIDPANRSLSLAGARVLAGQLREAVERRHAIAVVRVGQTLVHGSLPASAGVG